MEDIKLILLDLDGTLLLEKGDVPKELNEVIKKLNDKGILLGIATGRYYGSVKKVFKDTYKDMVVVSSNGASVYVKDKNVLFNPYKEDLYKDLLNIALKLNNPNISIQPLMDEEILMNENASELKFFEEYGMPVKPVKSLSDYTKDICCFSLMTLDQSPYDFSSLYKDYLEKIDIMPSGYGCVDIMPKGISKASGIRHLCELINIDISEVMAMGDAMNDYEMLKTVGLPVAMKNADERIKEIAKLETDKPNYENGCLDFIKKYFKLD